jgi:3-methyladenine DNA glycosylase AlkD
MVPSPDVASNTPGWAKRGHRTAHLELATEGRSDSIAAVGSLARLAVVELEARLAAAGSSLRAVNEKAYMKSALRFHGVTTAEVRAAGRDYCRGHSALSRTDLRGVVNALWASGWFDLRSTAIVIVEQRADLLRPADLPWLVELVREAACWAHVDHLSTRVLPVVLALDGDATRRRRAWAVDKSFWVRRAALLSLLTALRRGEGDFALFAELAAPMLDEKEFFIRKAIGWVLREVGKKRPQLTHAFLSKHRARVSGLTLREGGKYLPARLRASLGLAPAISRSAAARPA